MLDLRIYRAAFLPALAAFVALMFSLEPAPEPLERAVSEPAFDGRQAARTARAIVNDAPERAPGSAGDAAIGDLVRERFATIERGRTFEQLFDSSFEGEGVELRNVMLALPGTSDEVLLLVAHRDSARGAGAASSAAATAVLLSLAELLGAARHELTIVLASTDGGSDGATGARRLVAELEAPEGIGAAIVISQPGAAEAERPFVVAAPLGPRSPSPQLVDTAREIAETRFGDPDQRDDPWLELSRLAYPSGLGEQAALESEDVPTVAVSSSGERPIEPERDGVDQLSAETLEAVGATVLGLLLAVDAAGAELADAPAGYLRLGDNLIPGWAISLLALALLLPPLLVAADTWLRDLRRDRRGRRAVPWVGERALIPLVGLMVAYALGLIGVLPSPRFPYDPGRFGPGVGAVIGLILLAAALVLVVRLVRPMRTPLDVEPQTLASAAGILCGGSLVVIWLLNPYLALLLSPAAHVWLLPARAMGPPRRALVALAVLIALAPAASAGATVAAELGLGSEALWHLVPAVIGGGIPFGIALAACGLIGGLLACVAAPGAAAALEPPRPDVRVRGPGGAPGPGALGGPPSR